MRIKITWNGRQLEVVKYGEVLSCIACRNDIGVSNHSEVTDVATDVKEPGTDKELSFNKLIMTIICDYPESENCNVYYFMCVMNDGSVYSMNFELANRGSAYGTFMDKWYYCDEDVWNEAEDIKLLGKLPENKTLLLRENIVKVNKESDHYSRDELPDVVETIYYSAYCYPTEKTKEKRSFCVKQWGEKKGCMYNKYDEFANAILDIVKEDQLYDIWMNQHISNLEDLLPDWENE